MPPNMRQTARRMNHRHDTKAQKRAETVAEAVKLRADGMSFRAIAERLSVSHATAQRMVRDALADTVPAAVRDHRAVVLQRIDEVYESQTDLSNPVAAAVALKAAALEARTFIPSPGTDSTRQVMPAIQVVNTITNTGRWLSPEDERRAQTSAFVINVDERLIPPPTAIPPSSDLTDTDRGLPAERAYRAPVDAVLDALDS